MSYLLMSVRVADSEQDFGNDIDLACLELDEQTCKTILRRQQMWFKARSDDSELYEMSFWDYAPTWLHATQSDDDTVEKVLNNGGPTVVNELPVFDDEASQRVEVPQMYIREDGVTWIGSPKHSDFYVTTEEVPFTVFESLLEASTHA